MLIVKQKNVDESCMVQLGVKFVMQTRPGSFSVHCLTIFAFRGEKCEGGKVPKERVTVLGWAKFAGESEKLLVIGKALFVR